MTDANPLQIQVLSDLATFFAEAEYAQWLRQKSADTCLKGDLNNIDAEWCDASGLAQALVLNEADTVAHALFTLGSETERDGWRGHVVVGNLEDGWLLHLDVSMGPPNDEGGYNEAFMVAMIGDRKQLEQYMHRIVTHFIKEKTQPLIKGLAAAHKVIDAAHLDAWAIYQPLVEAWRSNTYLAPLLALHSEAALTTTLATAPSVAHAKPRV